MSCIADCPPCPNVCMFARQPEPPPPPPAARGKDGHLTLAAKGSISNDFFGNAASPVGRQRRTSSEGGSAFPSSRAPAATSTAAPSAAAAATSSAAQQKFGNAKAISSKDFQDGNRER